VVERSATTQSVRNELNAQATRTALLDQIGCGLLVLEQHHEHVSLWARAKANECVLK
tara:strand:- start:114 stop:284 length:171 start_codon:yes stop_codon:yes gene_type:complete